MERVFLTRMLQLGLLLGLFSACSLKARCTSQVRDPRRGLCGWSLHCSCGEEAEAETAVVRWFCRSLWRETMMHYDDYKEALTFVTQANLSAQRIQDLESSLSSGAWWLRTSGDDARLEPGPERGNE